MNEYDFRTTKDQSVGLYNNNVNDIYHSSHGAFKESIEKFALASCISNLAKQNSNLNILDICYGIGYNSKTLLYLAKQANRSIKINITASEINEDLVLISPFVRDTIPSLDLHIFLMSKIFQQDKAKFNKIFKVLPKDIDAICSYFSPHLLNYLTINNHSYSKCMASELFPARLHNIYYKYISKSINNSLECNIYGNCSFNYASIDARQLVKKLNTFFDVVFLDAFTPQKDPTLWTYDFIKVLKSKLHSDSILVTYSNSTPYRAALIELGFYVGKTIINGKQFGTVASLNNKLIRFPLDKFDIGLTKTTAGVTYKDPNLNLNRETLITNRETEKSKSDRIATSRYKKNFAKETSINAN